jgi:hypothetical protein
MTAVLPSCPAFGITRYPAGSSAGDDRISNEMHGEVDCTYVPSVMQCTVDLRRHLKMKTVNMKVMEELFYKG